LTFCLTGRVGFPLRPIGSRSFPAMLFLRNIQAQKPDFLFFCYKTEEDISQNLCSIGPLSLEGEG
ncbi:TPA: hypothetical protein ACIGS8_002261, partial [Escherichia coli]